METDMGRVLRDEETALAETINRLNRLDGLGRRAEAAAETMRDELRDRPLSIEKVRKIDVLLYTGGPAGGITFVYDDDRWGRSYVSAELWHQEWFTPKAYQSLDDDVGEALWNEWGLSEMDLNE